MTSLKSKANKSVQKSKSAIVEPDHAFPYPLFEQLAHFDLENPEENPIGLLADLKRLAETLAKIT